MALSSWQYHFGQVGTSVMVSATSLVALLHVLVPLFGALANLVWVALVSALMLVGSSPRTHASSTA